MRRRDRWSAKRKGLVLFLRLAHQVAMARHMGNVPFLPLDVGHGFGPVAEKSNVVVFPKHMGVTDQKMVTLADQGYNFNLIETGSPLPPMRY